MQHHRTNLYLSVKEVAARYSVSVNSVWRWTSQRDDFPKPIKLGLGCTRWRLSDLEAFESSCGETQ
tara:strand:+ start:1532 stop:1729 length:198 start_codon:yes stop_codon:yes gene_type:complete